jgi:hypothetical protein
MTSRDPQVSVSDAATTKATTTATTTKEPATQTAAQGKVEFSGRIILIG